MVFLSRCSAILMACTLISVGCTAKSEDIPAYLDRAPEDEIIYFVMPDRFENADTNNDTGGIEGSSLEHGFNPSHKGFYHGGDLNGLTSRLDYIEGLGVSAIWLGPIFKNKAVQGRPGEETSGYHGYWITDFTDVDPHLGTRDDLKTFVDEAHARGLKVYLDIIVNHTADVIYYEECHGVDASPDLGAPGACPYRGKTDYPYTQTPEGDAINTGFVGGQTADQTPENFAKLTRPDYAYTPRILEGEEDIKVPAWLNDQTLYHNRGDSAWYGENAVFGDFSGLDDLFTENPKVRAGFIEIYKRWITDFRIDGFRIDTAKHVSPDFWPVFNAAMIDHAASLGIPNFYVFGEVYSPDPVELARFTRLHGFPTVLDFANREALVDVLANGAPSDQMARVFQADALYADGERGATSLPVFASSHDQGRLAHYIRNAAPDMSDEDIFKRVRLGHALLLFGRGIPVIYYGDEQGFVGDGGDQDAREDMFPSKVITYNDNDLVATTSTTADSNFDPDHPLYTDISNLAKIYHAETGLRRGQQITRLSEPGGGMIVLSRIDPDTDTEFVFAANTSNVERQVHIETNSTSTNWTSLLGTCSPTGLSASRYELSVQPLDFILCKSSIRTPAE